MRRILLACLLGIAGISSAGAMPCGGWVPGHYYQGNWIGAHYNYGGFVSGHYDHFSPVPGVHVRYWVPPGPAPHYNVHSWWW